MNRNDRTELKRLARRLEAVYMDQVQPIAEALNELADQEQEKADNMADTNMVEKAEQLQEVADEIYLAADEVANLESEFESVAESVTAIMETY